VLPSNPDFQKLEPAQAYWYYSNIVSESKKLEESMSGSSGDQTIFNSKVSKDEFVRSFKESQGKK